MPQNEAYEHTFRASDLQKRGSHEPHDVHVIGCGTTGRRLICELVAMGVPQVHVYDDDIVKDHNRRSQGYYPKHIGLPKVVAVHDTLEEQFPEKEDIVVPHEERVSRMHRFSGFVFSMVDSMSARGNIMHALKGNVHVPLYIDGRMGPDGGKVIAMDPANGKHLTYYMDPANMFPDAAGGEVCEKSPLAGALASRVVCEAIERWIHWLDVTHGRLDGPFYNVVSFCYTPHYQTQLESWDK